MIEAEANVVVFFRAEEGDKGFPICILLAQKRSIPPLKLR